MDTVIAKNKRVSQEGSRPDGRGGSSREGGTRTGIVSIIVLTLALLISLSGSGQAAVDVTQAAAGKSMTHDNDSQSRKNYKEGELLVKFKSAVTDTEKEDVHKKYGSKRIKKFHDLHIDHIELKGGLSVEDAIRLYKADPDVEYAEPNYLVTAQGVPDNPLFDQLWGLFNTGQTGGTPGADIDAPNAWSVTTGTSDAVVAIIDTGVDYTHPDLAANIWVNSDEIAGNGIDDDGNGYVDDIYGIDVVNKDSNPFDDMGHGTHCAGTIGAVGNNSIGVAGVNWSVKIMACKFLNAGGSGTMGGAINCLEYIRAMKARGVNIIATSNSWGCSGGGCYSQALYDAINAQRDILFIAAAGNNNTNNDAAPFYPADYYLPNLITIAATDHTDGRAYFSNYGRRSVSVGAPGLRILSTLPAQNAWGTTGGYGTLSGTSMATPHVTGLAALLKSQDMTRDWRAIRNLVLSGGDNTSAMNGITITGKRINAYGSLTCTNSPVFSALLVPSSFATGTPVTLSALSINCASPVGPVTVTSSAGETITLNDDGVAPDLAAGDGIFSATATFSQNYTSLTFSSPAATEKVTIPLAITSSSLPNGSVNTPYSQTLQASGGVLPYTWSITSGNLPTGFTLNSSTGVISGTATIVGSYSFTAQVTDSESGTASKPLSITITGPLPDLTTTAVSSPTTAMTGQQITVNATVKNQGQSNAGAFTVDVYLSGGDAVITAGDYYFGKITVASLAVGAQQDVSLAVTVPEIPAGTYYIGAVADRSNSVAETDETNNALAGNQISIAILPPDLTMAAVSGPASGGTGAAITMSGTVQNLGGSAGGSHVGFYLSTDANITTTDTMLGTVYVNGLAAGAQQAVSGTFTIPVGLAPGTYYLGAIADNYRYVTESDETNNAMAGNTITVSIGADLIMTAVSGPASGSTGAAITMTGTAKNQGTGSAGGSYVGFYLSTDANITTADTMLGTVYVSGLAAGAQQAVSGTFTIPVGLAPGTYYLGAIADNYRYVTESNETNNALEGNQITIN